MDCIVEKIAPCGDVARLLFDDYQTARHAALLYVGYAGGPGSRARIVDAKGRLLLRAYWWKDDGSVARPRVYEDADGAFLTAHGAQGDRR